MTSRKLGTFLGVYTPTVLTILGVIMYLRFGWLVGHLGLARVLGIVVAAHVISVITTLSFSSVATNGRVGAGGAYYIISRSLGLEVGGAVGLPLFLSQTLSVTLYSFGLAESLRFVWPGVPIQPVAAAIIIAVGVLSLFGADAALRSQMVLMLLVAVSIVAMVVGAWLRGDPESIASGSPSGELGFWQGFAIFFPAVTGVMAGLGLSGDLTDPERSIPRGALLAVGTGLAVYLIVPVFLALGAPRTALQNDPLVWTSFAIGGTWLVLPGLWSAIFSSAVGSVLGAPRTLQSLARDGLAPAFLARERGFADGLVPGLTLTVGLALAAVLIGDLNAVAAVVSMFFLTVYATVNLAAAFETLSGDPTWRPTLRIPWSVSLVGGLGSLIVMFLIAPRAATIALLAECALFLWLSRRERTAGWGDARRGLYESLIRWSLIRLNERPMTRRSWRPHTLVFVDGVERELDLVRYADWFSQGRGVVTVCQIVIGDLATTEIDIESDLARMREVLEQEGLVVFPEIAVARSIAEGIVDVAQANGIAGLSSNTILLGWPSDPELQIEFLKIQRMLTRLNKSLIIARVRPRHQFARRSGRREIHVWWGGLERNGDLMLLLAYLLGRNPEWRDSIVVIKSVATTETMREQTRLSLERMLNVVRINAEYEVLLKQPDTRVSDMIHEASGSANVIFLGLARTEAGKEHESAVRIEQLADDLPCVFFVHNASPFSGNLLDSGEYEIVEKAVRTNLPGGPSPLP